MARSAGDQGRLDFGRGGEIARDSAQLGILRAQTLPAGHLDPRTVAQSLIKAAGLRNAAAKAPLGSWTLLDAETMLAAPRCTSAFPNGEIHFVEDHSGPPSRAYLKLWEALTVIGCRPGPGERCLDLGSSPGGWSWALQRLGAHVVSVDKAPLAPDIARLSEIEHRLESAFALDPH